MPKLLNNYAEGRWIPAPAQGDTLYHAVTGTPIFIAGSHDLDFDAMMKYARSVGGPALRALTFHERGRMLKSLALHLLEQKKYFYELSAMTGATKADSWVDIEGGIGNLFA